MRIRLDRYEIKHVSLQTRSVIYFIASVPAILVGSFFFLMGLLIIVVPDGSTMWERRGGFVLAIFFGLLPIAIGVLAFWRGMAARGRIKLLRELATLGRVRATIYREDVQAKLNLAPEAAERVLLEAMTDGILERTPEDDRRAAAPPVHASHPPPAPYGSYPSHPPATPHSPGPSNAPPPPSRAEPGAVFGGTYQLEAPLGAGGMGEVWVARHLRTGRKYALKVLPAASTLDPEAIKRFEREALAASALGHPNIVAVHDFHREGAMPYMVMDLLEGETLEQRLTRVGSLPWQDAKRIALELAYALAAAHEAGLLHRDLKPANVCLVPQPGGKERAVLLDFGLVKQTADVAVSRITMTGAALGTPLYMSPEQARGEPLDERSDVYALGAVLFEMLTGAPPFFDRTIAAVYARLLAEVPPAVSALAPKPCPPAVDVLLARTLAKEKSERPPSARAFGDALVHVDEGTAPFTERIA
jgi:serine/threonine-protein kinase